MTWFYKAIKCAVEKVILRKMCVKIRKSQENLPRMVRKKRQKEQKVREKSGKNESNLVCQP